MDLTIYLQIFSPPFTTSLTLQYYSASCAGIREADRCAYKLIETVLKSLTQSHLALDPDGDNEVGYDAGKQMKSRKIHALVDSEGLPMRVVVQSAAIQDRDEARLSSTRYAGGFVGSS